MLNLREIPLVRVLLVALVVLFVCGAGVGGAFARVEMQNGHEGDPTDGHDIIGGGGSGWAFPGPEDAIVTGKSEDLFLINNLFDRVCFIENKVTISVFVDGKQLILLFVSDDIFWGQK